MKKAAIILGACVLAAVAGWSALWFSGKGEVEARLALERDRLAAAGVDFAHGTPEIGGYPFGYSLRLPDVTLSSAPAGAALRLPEVLAETTLRERERLSFVLPERFTLELAPAPAAAEGEAEPSLVIEFEAEGLTLERRLSGATEEFAIRAASLLGVDAGAGQDTNAAVEIVDLDATVTRQTRPDGPESTLKLTAGTIDYLATDRTETGADSRFEGFVSRLGVTAATDQTNLAGLAATLAGAPGGGRISLAVQTGPFEARGQVEAALAAAGGMVQMSSGTSIGTFRLDDGRFDLSFSSENNRLALVPADDAVPVRGAVTIDRIESVYRSPLAPGAEMQDLAFRVALGRIHPDDAFWQALDPDGRLTREPGEILLDLTGTARMVADTATGLPGAAEFGTLTLRHADIALLGARAEARGDLSFTQPGNRPDGGIRITLTRSMELVGELIRAGLLDLEAAQILMDAAANYTRPGDAPGVLIGDLEFEEGEARLNGNPLWFLGGAE